MMEIGSLDINGGVRDLLDPLADYVGIDAQDGPGVNVVVDAAHYLHRVRVDIVLCLEVLEHCEQWRGLVKSAASNLKPGGRFIATCATNSRPPHSAIDGGQIHPEEWYANVHCTELLEELEKWFADTGVDVAGNDLRGWATR